ncbi:hypothetical protein FQR65_LT06941 [Abscondita terminalis]|nr:hypothetical protein FQR65_LT06941 [Abscondita terminalis]
MEANNRPFSSTKPGNVSTCSNMLMLSLIVYNVASAAIITPYEDESSLQLCLSSIIKNVFKKSVPIYYVNGRATPFTPHNTTNQYVFVDTRDPLYWFQFGLEMEQKNFILFGSDTRSVENAIAKLMFEEWSTKFNSKTIYVIVTPHPYPEEIFLLFWRVDIVNVLVLRTNFDRRRLSKLYTSNPFSKNNRCGLLCNVYETQLCGSSMRLKKFERVRNFNECPVVITTKPEKGVPSIHRRVSDFAMHQMKAYLNITYYYSQKTSRDKHILIQEYLKPTFSLKIVSLFEDDTVWVSKFQKRIPDTKILRSVFTKGVWMILGGCVCGLRMLSPRSFWFNTVFITLIFQNFSHNPLERVAHQHDCHTFGARHLVAKFEIDNNTKLNTFVDNSVIGKLNMVYMVIEGYPFYDVLQKFMRKFVETGLHSKVVVDTKRMYYFKTRNDEGNVVLTLGHFGEAFFCWGLGLILSGIIFVVELIKH